MQKLYDINTFIQVNNNIATAGQPTMRDLEKIADAGYQIVINLGLQNSDYALENEKTWVEQLGMKYVHIPVDFKKPVEQDFIRFLNTMNIYQNNRIFVHCAENKRASVFVALYLVVTGRLSQIDGFNLIIRSWEPNLVWESYYYALLNQFYQVKEEIN